MSTPGKVTVRIENAYECGRESSHLAEVDPPEFIDSETMDEWWDDVVYDETGDGHPCGASEGSNYTATIVEAPGMTVLIGQTKEWG